MNPSEREKESKCEEYLLLSLQTVEQQVRLCSSCPDGAIPEHTLEISSRTRSPHI